MSIVFKGKKGAGTITVESGPATVGTRSTCHLVLEDPMVAEKHAVLTQEGPRFFVADLGTSSGTYLNGLPVEGRVEVPAAGESSIVLGVSRLLTTVDAEKGILTVTVKEASFFYDKRTEPLEWVRAEVDFGRFAPVRLGNWAALGLSGLLIALAFVDPVAEPALEPGPLASVHAAAIAGKHPSDSCAGCHAPLRGTPTGRCAPCHQEIVASGAHPKDWDGLSCQPCHSDHRGRESDRLTTVRAQDTCGRCHEADRPLAARPAARAPEQAWVALTYLTFPHAAHLTADAKARGVECGSCHRALPAGEALPADRAHGKPRREYGRIEFAVCQSCHGPEGKARTAWTVTWHGTDQGDASCRQCHAAVHEPQLRTVERRQPPEPREPRFRHAFVARDHGEQLALQARAEPAKACTTCHKDGIAGGTARYADRGFPHATHLSSIDARGPMAGTIDAQCRSCHAEQLEARSLATPAFAGAKGDCKECHTAGLESRAPDAGPEATRTVADFPHAKHAGLGAKDLAAGCLSCHATPASIDDLRPPATTEAARSCKPCHERHRNVGGGACDRCHAEGDPVYTGKPVMRTWPEPNSFSHRSRGHEGVACELCHVGTDASKSLRDLPIPAESDASCRKCHIQERARLHWK